ncbi:MAG: hypothetical protein RIR11_3646 [Bacteroidota bacterium]
MNLDDVTPNSPKIRRNWLLVIGIDKYKEPKLKLNNCVSDVTTLAELLCKRYHFEASDIIRLLNAEATASNINKVLKEARAHSSEDNLIIFFSGHGSSEELTGEYYWQPWEADHEDETTWYALNHFKASLKALPHQHILVIVDACFPIGVLRRGNSNNVVAQLDQEKSRFALTSGRNHTVSDGNPGEQSPFAAALIRALTTNDQQWLRVGSLYDNVLNYTSRNTNGTQLPKYETIPGFENCDGEFCLQLRSNFINKPSNNLELATPILPRYFKAIPIAHIQPSDLMPLRSRPSEGFRAFYHERSYLDDQLYQNYAIRQHTIITGKPLAGKTRAALQLIKKLDNQDITVLLPKEGSISKEDFQWPKQGNYIFFIDEIDRFLENDNGEWLLQKILSFENVFVLATCWQDKYPEVKNNIAQYLHTFKEQKIGLLNDDDIQIIIMYAPKSILTRSDRTIGSYFLPMHEMKRRYESLTKGSLEQEIFRTCKVYFYWNNINRSTYSKQKIKEYIDIRFQKHYGRAESFFPAQWESAFHLLHELSLLEEQIDELVVEEIYLSDFIIEDQEALFKEYITYFPSYKNSGKAIRISDSRERAARIFDFVKQYHLPIDVYVYTNLINKIGHRLNLLNLLEEMRVVGIKPNEFTFNSLINKATTIEATRQLLEEMKTAGIKPNEFTFNSLINKATTLEATRPLLEEMKTAGIKPNEFTFTSLINKASTLEAAGLLLEEMKTAGIKPNEVTFNSLINKVSILEAARTLLEEMKTAGIKPNEVTFTSLINKASTLEAARTLLEEMKTAGIKPNEVTFTSLINKASTLEAARLLLEEMKMAGIKPDEFTFNSLINKAATFEASRLLLEEMKTAGIEPDTFTFSNLIRKSSSIEHVLFVLEELNMSIPSVDIDTYNFMLNSTKNINFIESFLSQMKKYRISINEFTFEIISDIVHNDLDSSEDFFLAMIECGDLFNTDIWLKLFIYECLPNIYQYPFWENNVSEIISQDDEIITLFAWQCHIPEYKILLTESLKDKNWNYYALMGESHILLDWKTADTYFENALENVIEEQKYVIGELIAKNIVWNYLTDRYPEAWQYCIDALALQEKGYLHLSLQLLLHMLIEQTEFADLGDSIDNLLLVYPINHQELVCFLEEEFLDTKSVSTEKLKILNEICQREHD